ncbi:MAG TPA: hypothetical protein VNA32_05660 [Actinomycetota bacterium]|nr:hypothetical protein [Actinomycetota bacterium]
MNVRYAIAAGVVLAACSAMTGAGVSPPDVSGTSLPPASAPGATNPAVTEANIHQTICVTGWTVTIRPPVSYTSALKRRQMAGIGLTNPALFEEDHRVPLEVGGAPTDPANLYPEPWDGAHGARAKDLIENRVRADVCAGRMTLAQGQAVFLGDFWTEVVP